jgi:WD40 repeat protein
MSPGHKWKLLAVGCLPLALTAILYRQPGAGASGGPAGDLRGHHFPVQALGFGSGGASLTSAAYHLRFSRTGAELALWDATTGALTARRSEAPPESLRCLAIAPGGRRVAAGEHSLWLWDVDSPQGRRLLGERRTPFCTLAFAPDGSQLAAGDWENAVEVWDVASGRPEVRCERPTQPVFALAFAPGGAVLAGGGQEGAVRLWDVATGRGIGILRGHAASVMTAEFSPDGRTLATGDMGGTVKLWDMPSGAERAELTALGDEATAVAFTPDGRTLAVAVGDVVQLRNAVTGALVATLEGHRGRVRCLAFSPDGLRLASGSSDATVRLWDVARHTNAGR